MGDAKRLTRSEIIRNDGTLTQNLLKKLEHDADIMRRIPKIEELTNEEASEAMTRSFDFLQELQAIQDAPEDILWAWVEHASLADGAIEIQKFTHMFGSLGRYVKFCNDLLRMQASIRSKLPKEKPVPRELIQLAKNLCPKAFRILSSLLIQGYTRPDSNPRCPQGYAIENMARPLAFFLSDIESLRLSDAAQVFDSIYQGRAYYFDKHLCFFRFPDSPSEIGEIAVAVKAPDGLWSYDKWDNVIIPISSMRALKRAVKAAQEFRVRRYGLITHRHSQRLAEWMGLEIYKDKAFLPIAKTTGFKAVNSKRKSKQK